MLASSAEILTMWIAGSAAVRKVVQANARRGAQVIKVMATERAGTAETDFRRRALNDEELRAAVEEAARAGLGVAAHAHTDDGAHAAVLAGAKTIEHGTMMSESTLALMRQRQLCFVPTLSFWADMAEPGGNIMAPASPYGRGRCSPGCAKPSLWQRKWASVSPRGVTCDTTRAAHTASPTNSLNLHRAGCPR